MPKTRNFIAPGASEPDASLVLVLEALQAQVGISFDPEASARVVGRTPEDRNPLTRIAQAAPKLGMIAAPLSLSPEQMARLVGPGQPVVAGAQTSAEALALVQADGRRVRAISPSFPDGRWLGPSDIADLLGLSGPDVETSCLAIEPNTPMNALSFPGAQPGDVGTALRRLSGLLSTERADLRAIVIYAVGAGIFSLTIPVAVQTLVNTVAFGTLFQPLVVMTILVIAGLLLYGLLTALEVYVVELLQRRILLRVVGDLSFRVPRARTSALDKIYGPEQLNRFFDVFTIHKATAQLLIDGLDLALKGAIGLLLLAFYHPLLLAFDVMLIVALGLVVFGLGQGGLKTAIVESKKKYRLAGWLEELGRRPSMFKAPGALTLARDRADAYTRDFLLARISHFRVVLRQTVGALAIYAIASGLLLGIGGWLVMQGQLTLGQLVAAELVVTAVVTSFAKIGKHLESFYDLVAAVDKVGALFDLPVENAGGDGAPERPAARGSAFELDKVSVDISGQSVLRSVSLSLDPGDRASVLDCSGSGKSTLADVAFGLRVAKSGQVRIDQTHIEDIPVGTLRQRVVVARTDDVMQGSILDNVRLGDPAICADSARTALADAELLPVIERLPGGMDTEVLPGGRPLTESETARLVLARAIAAQPSLLVVDGVLDVQDEAVRNRLMKRLTAPDAPWTLLVLTRSEAIADQLPRRIGLDAGQMVPLVEEAR